MGLLRNLAARGFTNKIEKPSAPKAPQQVNANRFVRRLANGGITRPETIINPNNFIRGLAEGGITRPETKPNEINPLVKAVAGGGFSQAAPGSASTQIKINGPSQAEQIAAGESTKYRIGENTQNLIGQQLLARERDFIRERLIDKGAEGVDTDMVLRAQNAWQDNPYFQRDLAQDTGINRAHLLHPGLRDLIEKEYKDIKAGDLNVEDVSDLQLNLLHGLAKQHKFERMEGQINNRLQYLQQSNPNMGMMTWMRDPVHNQIRLQDTNLNQRAQQLVAHLQNGDLKATDLDPGDLGLAGEMLNFIETDNKKRESRRMSAAKDFLNAKTPNSQVNTQEFLDRFQKSNEKFDKLKKERGVLGAGAFGAVVPGDSGKVVKLQGPASDVWNDGTVRPNDALVEANNLETVRGMGIAPTVHSLETLPDGSTMLEMDDLSRNFKQMAEVQDTFNEKQLRNIDVKRAQQQGMANLKGVDLQDRHEGNVMLNNMTNNPIQVDFGIVDKLTNDRDKAIALAQNTAKGFHAAGQPEENEIFAGLVMEALERGDDKQALELAKQGFAGLQKNRSVSGNVVPTAAEKLDEARASLLSGSGVRF